MRIEVIPIQQNNKKMFAGVISAETLFNTFKIKTDEQSLTNEDGYQRTLTDNRAFAFLNFIEKAESAISPVSVLLNYREALGVSKHQEKTFVNIPDHAELWVVDGQHRLKGIERGVLEDNERVKKFEIPFVLMNERDQFIEALQFVIINKTQRGVKSDLAQTFLLRIKERDPEFWKLHLPKQVTKNIDWNPEALEVMYQLNEDKESPWYKKIQLPNQSKQRTVIPQTSFIDSLDPIFKDDRFREAIKDDMNKLAVLLKRYWRVIKEICPECFENPKKYVIQKTPGIFTLHKVFIRVINLAKQEDNKVSEESIKKILEKVSKVFNHQFWASKGEGAGKYGTNRKAFAMLYKEINKEFDKAKFKIDVESIEV